MTDPSSAMPSDDQLKQCKCGSSMSDSLFSKYIMKGFTLAEALADERPLGIIKNSG
jgi:hypothetical protein